MHVGTAGRMWVWVPHFVEKEGLSKESRKQHTSREEEGVKGRGRERERKREREI